MRQLKKEAIPALLVLLLPRLKLSDWQVELLAEPTQDGVNASINPCEGRKLATLRVAEYWDDLEGRDQWHALVHECIHLHLIGACDIVRLDTVRHLSQETYEVLWAGFKRQIEYAVDGLADAFAPLLVPRKAKNA